LHYVLRRHPFKQASLSDDDLQVNFAEHTQPTDRVAVVVTAPLTTDEAWTALTPLQVYTFEDGDAKSFSQVMSKA
jgi:glutamine amidotransferase